MTKSKLDCEHTLGILFASLHNFGFQMLLVGENVTVPLVDRLLLADPYRVSHLKHAAITNIILYTSYTVYLIN